MTFRRVLRGRDNEDLFFRGLADDTDRCGTLDERAAMIAYHERHDAWATLIGIIVTVLGVLMWAFGTRFINLFL